MKAHSLLILIPCYNEASNVAQLYQELQEVHWGSDWQVDFLFINDHSSDATLQKLRELHIPHLDLPINLGIGGAVQCGYRYALQHQYPYVARIDGDGQHPPGQLPHMLKVLRENEADVIIGSRFIGASTFASTRARRLGIKILSAWCKLLSGIKVYDITSGFNLINRRALALAAAHYPDTYPEPESVILYGQHHLQLCEVPVRMRNRLGGKSSISAEISVFYMVKVMLGLLFITLKIKRHGKYSSP